MEMTINIEEKINSEFNGEFNEEALKNTGYENIKDYLASRLYQWIDSDDTFYDDVIIRIERKDTEEGDIIRTYKETLEVTVGKENE